MTSSPINILCAPRGTAWRAQSGEQSWLCTGWWWAIEGGESNGERHKEEEERIRGN